MAQRRPIVGPITSWGICSRSFACNLGNKQTTFNYTFRNHKRNQQKPLEFCFRKTRMTTSVWRYLYYGLTAIVFISVVGQCHNIFGCCQHRFVEVNFQQHQHLIDLVSMCCLYLCCISRWMRNSWLQSSPYWVHLSGHVINRRLDAINCLNSKMVWGHSLWNFVSLRCRIKELASEHISLWFIYKHHLPSYKCRSEKLLQIAHKL